MCICSRPIADKYTSANFANMVVTVRTEHRVKYSALHAHTSADDNI